MLNDQPNFNMMRIKQKTLFKIGSCKLNETKMPFSKRNIYFYIWFNQLKCDCIIYVIPPLDSKQLNNLKKTIKKLS